jgi:3-oxoacyl-[acyl-carrier-protein] synthase-3
MKDFMDNIETYDGFVFHQANQLMIESMRKISKIPKSKFLLSLYDYGNTSSASRPLTICHNYPDQSLTGKFFFNGFGVGLSWGFATLNLNNTRILAIQRG